MSILPELLRKQLKLLLTTTRGWFGGKQKKSLKGKGEKEKHAVKADQLGW